LRISWPVDGN